MTTRSQVEKLRRSADRAARVARENRRLDYALQDIEIDLRYAVEKARGKLRALDFAGLQVEEERLPHCSLDCWTSRNVDTRGSSSATILAEPFGQLSK
jgi:hypothetical protein